MAKKQGVSYGPNSALIQGAATAYKNYDNAPGMYAGLDKVTKAGTDMMDTAVEGYKAKKEKIEQEAAAEKQKKKDQDNAWYKAAGDTYNAAGSFMKADGPELTDTIALLDELQPEYTKAMESGTAAEKAAVNARYQAIKGNVDGHKQLRADISDDLIGASDANFNTGTLGGDDGRFGDFLTGLLKEDYKITYKTDTEGVKQKMYTVGDASYSLEQINEKTVRKNRKPAVDYYDARTKISKKKTYDEAETRMVVKNIIPQGYNEMRDFMRGDYFDTGNFASLLEKDRERLKLEIGAQFDLDNKNGIDDKEFDNFISAATDPYHEMWNKGDKVDKQGWEDSSRAIAEDLLVNGIKNKQALDNPEDPTWKKEGYANKGAYLKAVKAAQGDFTPDAGTETEVGVDEEGNVITDPNDPNYVAVEPTSSSVFNLINVGDDDDASKNLNTKLGLKVEGQMSEKSKVAFAPYSGDVVDKYVFGVGTGLMSADAPGTNDIMMYNPRTGDVYKDADDEVIRFNTGDKAFVELGEGKENPTALRIIEELKKLGVDTSKLDVGAKIDVTRMSKEQIDNQIKNLKGE